MTEVAPTACPSCEPECSAHAEVSDISNSCEQAEKTDAGHAARIVLNSFEVKKIDCLFGKIGRMAKTTMSIGILNIGQVPGTCNERTDFVNWR